MQTEPPLYVERIVAFIDILGFEGLVRSLQTNPELHARLYRALHLLNAYAHKPAGLDPPIDIEVSSFSDSIVISAEPQNAFHVLWQSGWLQADLLYSGILTRGGISVGATVHRQGILYGEGMLKAYQIEKSAAVYPRIVIEPSLVDWLGPRLKERFLDRDSDGLWFVEPFNFDTTPGYADALESEEHAPREVYFREVASHISAGLASSTRVDHFAKWRWLANRLDIANEQVRQTRLATFDCTES